MSSKHRPDITTSEPFARHALTAVFWLIAAFYAYGALVHVLNMLSLTGFPWMDAPRKWQLLDVVYLCLDLVVVLGLIRGWWIGIAAFFAATFSQIALYTVFRPWVLDVPPAFRPSPEDLAYLDGLVAFHLMAGAAMCAVIVLSRRTASA